MLSNLTKRFRTWRLRHDTARRLRALDNRLLADIGAEREAIDDFVRDRVGT
ncbi:DUF1127 domain-containing protein [Devosia sp. PTR5]|jgi:uncharacterized protein YjiS (DUF1127 family)|uniref:DUF1127 domain-containing protein n=1 Tax=Devosia oryzisoli TaxID=2774138 RepID=A0A927FWS9_9HYPH|nr:DUF1127 domain-containing protein [Devosia oryzisoli]MBD8066268.1 DUF1127 domain-containing protein [Devosia oryzisoli]